MNTQESCCAQSIALSGSRITHRRGQPSWCRRLPQRAPLSGARAICWWLESESPCRDRGRGRQAYRNVHETKSSSRTVIGSILTPARSAQFRWETPTGSVSKRNVRSVPGTAAVMSQILLLLCVQANRSLRDGSILGTETSAESGHSTDSSKPPGKCEHGQQMVAALRGRRSGDHRSLPGDARDRGRSRVPVPDYGASDPHGRRRASVGEQMNADTPRRLTVVDGGEQPRAS